MGKSYEQLLEILKPIVEEEILGYLNVELAADNHLANVYNNSVFKRTLPNNEPFYFSVKLLFDADREILDINIVVSYEDEDNKIQYYYGSWLKELFVINVINDDNIVENFKEEFNPFKILKAIYRIRSIADEQIVHGKIVGLLEAHLINIIRMSDPVLLEHINVTVGVNGLLYLYLNYRNKDDMVIIGIMGNQSIKYGYYNKITDIEIVKILNDVIKFIGNTKPYDIAVVEKLNYPDQFQALGLKSRYFGDRTDKCLFIVIENDKQYITLSLLEGNDILFRYKR